VIELVALVSFCSFAGQINEGSFQLRCSALQEIRLQFSEEGLTPQKCLMQGQTELARWSVEHPDGRIKKFSCVRPGRGMPT
jgi:hypothetical protein